MPLVPRKLVTLPGCFAIQALDPTGPEGAWLTISRDAASVDGVVLAMESEAEVKSRGPAGYKDIDAVLGVIRLLSGPYLCVCTGSTLVANGPGGSSFHCVDRVQLLALQSSATLTADQQRDEKAFLSLLRSVFATKSFYFAASYEITHTAQRIYQRSMSSQPGEPEAMSPHAWVRSDDRFLWNFAWLQDFRSARESTPAVDEFVTPLINGFVKCNRDVAMGAGGPTFDLLLLSRRSRHRQGTRFHRRGIDIAGDVANFVETEQLLLHSDGRISSHVQVRGSIPVFWTQTPTLKYTPKCALGPLSEEQAHLACSSHFRALNKTYGGEVVAVNLIDTKGDQLMLGRAFEDAITKAAAAGCDAKFVWFDFHKECRKMQWHRLSLLMDKVQSDLQGHGLFMTGTDGQMTQSQRGVMRTNCMDNLDRTNVVQSLFARWAILQAFPGVRLPPAPSVLDSGLPPMERVFKATWADNADAMSLLYSGTPALKTDFTRTGKRTIAGALQDGKNSVTRYFLNNLVDGRRQDAWDLFLGRYSPNTSAGKHGYNSAKSPLRAAQNEFTPTSLLFSVLLLNLVLVGGTAATLSSLDVAGPRVGAAIGSVVSAVVVGLLSYFQMGKGVGMGPAIASKPHFTTKGDVDRDAVA